MYPKNIQEYIVREIIAHNKYRDLEIEQLNKILQDFDITKCDVCLEYTRDGGSCGQCDFKCCGKCYDSKIKHVNTWNLSGTEMCEKCILTHCHFCISELESTDIKCPICNSIHCETCRKRWPKCCKN